MTEKAPDMRAWWAWFERIDRTVKGRSEILSNSVRALEQSCTDERRQIVIDSIAEQISVLEQDAISAERLRRRLGDSRASVALTNVTIKLDTLSSKLCDLVVGQDGPPSGAL